MTAPDRAALRAIAEAASTHTDWELDLNNGRAFQEIWAAFHEIGETIYVLADGGSAERQALATHIAAFDPPTVLALLDRIEALEALLYELAYEHQSYGLSHGRTSTRIWAALGEQARDRLAQVEEDEHLS